MSLWEQAACGIWTARTRIANYEVFIDKIANKSKSFARPVLLINGDSHRYRSDNPLKENQSCVIESGSAVIPCAADAWKNHFAKGYAAPNFHPLVVHGSTFPLEYLRLTVDPGKNYSATNNTFGPFSWERIMP